MTAVAPIPALRLAIIWAQPPRADCFALRNIPARGGGTMPAETVERKLVAILAADIAGFSRLVGADEEGTLARLKTLRRDLIDPTIAEHRGRIVKTTGDGMLVEFASVVDAVRCAVAVQHATGEREAGLPQEQRIEFRVGINLGDIVVEGDDILGDGVNIAARLEGIADPGGICISGVVHDQVRGRSTWSSPISASRA
jgi:adenylate cyclase